MKHYGFIEIRNFLKRKGVDNLDVCYRSIVREFRRQQDIVNNHQNILDKIYLHIEKMTKEEIEVYINLLNL